MKYFSPNLEDKIYMKKFDHPIVAYLVIFIISLISAVLLFQIDGSSAGVDGEVNEFVKYKAGGAIAGFIIIFLISYKVILHLEEKRKMTPVINVRVYLLSKSTVFNKSAIYDAEYVIFDSDTGDSETFSTKTFWEAGFLTVFIKGVGEKDYLSVKIIDNTNTWRTETFHSRSPKIAELN